MMKVKRDRRKGIKELEAEGVNFITAKVMLKIDGVSIKFGKDIDGVPFFETSKSGPIYKVGTFAEYSMKEYSSISQRAIDYDCLMQCIFDNFVDALEPDTKIFAEVLYNRFRVENEKEGYSRFMLVDYPDNMLGTNLTLFPWKAFKASTGEVKVIPSHLFKLNNPVNRVYDCRLGVFSFNVNGLNSGETYNHIHNEMRRYNFLGDDLEGFIYELPDGTTFKTLEPSFKARLTISLRERMARSRAKKRIEKGELTPPQKEKVGVMIGRFQPFHKDHLNLYKKLDNPIIFIVDGKRLKKNPLTFEYRKQLIMKVIPDARVFHAINANMKTVLNKVRELGYEPSSLIAGSDRCKRYTEIIDEMEGYEVKVICNHRTKDEISGTVVRKYIEEDDYNNFKRVVPPQIVSEYTNLRRKISEFTKS